MSLFFNFFDNCQYFVVKKIYGDHNESAQVKSAIRRLFLLLPDDFVGLNVGSGKTNLHPNLKNLELSPGNGIDYVGSVTEIPCNKNSFDVVIAQEVLEHVASPSLAIKEISRVLKVGGYLYLQLPFIIGYHPCPNDYWRFTHEGILELLDPKKFKVVEAGMSVGPAVGFYRILVEFIALCLSLGVGFLYKPAKLLSAIFFWPIKLLDSLLIRTIQADRISGGYYIIGLKK
ncbi:MAG: hypothetical protein CMF41_00880 [Legionellales bacterium]|nr:hypothetical protein [Legionellales bacterium]OUX66220.1 MAG: hypothetical protein CBE41_00500 [Gammaproteobacteria bacterium TMED281]|tara:strand:- start:1140 stop:1829 length:690 start_codon:yes stop_codon:yes gene_type:complete